MPDLMPDLAVYCLGDPETGAVRYVGITSNPQARAVQHGKKSNRCNPEQRLWKKRLLKRKLRPVFVLLFWTENPMDEFRIIDQMLAAGEPLTNVQDLSLSPITSAIQELEATLAQRCPAVQAALKR